MLNTEVKTQGEMKKRDKFIQRYIVKIRKQIYRANNR